MLRSPVSDESPKGMNMIECTVVGKVASVYSNWGLYSASALMYDAESVDSSCKDGHESYYPCEEATDGKSAPDH